MLLRRLAFGTGEDPTNLPGAAPKAANDEAGKPIVELDSRYMAPPENLQMSKFRGVGGGRIRYAWVEPKDRKVERVSILVTGFRESIERYHELMGKLAADGEAVWAMDWRGQGGSDRYCDMRPQRPSAQGYELDAADLDKFINQVVCPTERYPSRARVLYAHSMGAQIALRHRHDYPDSVDAMVATSPMMALRTRGLPRIAARAIANFMSHIGVGHLYAPGCTDWHERELRTLTRSLMDDRTIRQHLHLLFYREMPAMRMGGPNHDWLKEAFRSTGITTDPAYLREINTPVFLAVSGRDWLVYPKATFRSARHLPKGEVSSFPDSLHSLWHEDDRTIDKL